MPPIEGHLVPGKKKLGLITNFNDRDGIERRQEKKRKKKRKG